MARREEMTARLEALKERKFYLWMKDYWNNEDRKIESQLTKEIIALETELKKENTK